MKTREGWHYWRSALNNLSETKIPTPHSPLRIKLCSWMKFIPRWFCSQVSHVCCCRCLFHLLCVFLKTNLRNWKPAKYCCLHWTRALPCKRGMAVQLLRKILLVFFFFFFSIAKNWRREKKKVAYFFDEMQTNSYIILLKIAKMSCHMGNCTGTAKTMSILYLIDYKKEQKQTSKS